MNDLKNWSRDHVPPTSIFLKADRNFPLLVPAHTSCNNDRSSEDEAIGQLVGLLHGQAPPANKKIEIGIAQGPADNPQLWGGGFDLRKVIRRWVRGFHAALYHEALLEPGEFQTFPPWAEAERDDDGVHVVPVQEIVPEFVHQIKRSRMAKSLDRVVTRNDKCVYECMWLQADRGQWFCAYALKIYDWSTLGDVKAFGKRGCVGSYRRPGGGTPKGAAEGTVLEFLVPNADQLDPFGD